MLLKCDCNFLIIPINRNSQKKIVKFFYNGMLILDLEIELSIENPEQYFYYNIERFAGKMLELLCDLEPELSLKKAVAIPRDELYSEQLRPQFHFTAKAGWLNDPNGLCYANGIYHMFFQHNPVGCNWGNMHWGHATSPDLIHWKEEKLALFPDRMGTMYSGSAIVDKYNVARLKQNENDTILLFYTAAGEKSLQSKGQPFTQCMAYSIDGGVHFEKYTNNPLIDWIEAENRDPKVTYCKETNSYIMALYLTDNKYALLSSMNLLEWEVIFNVWIENEAECPDFYPLCVDGDSNNVKWVFSGAADRYALGVFYGQFFRIETLTKQLAFGDVSYAAQTWSDTRDGDERRIRISWNRGEIPGMPFNQCMNFPCEMGLVSDGDEIFLTAYPIREIEQLYGEIRRVTDTTLEIGEALSWVLAKRQCDIKINVELLGQDKFEITICDVSLICDGETEKLIYGEVSIPIYDTEKLEIRMLIDTTTIELFVNGGRAISSINNMNYRVKSDFKVEILSGKVSFSSIVISEIGSTWELSPLHKVHAMVKSSGS